jgi:hypothetical protein
MKNKIFFLLLVISILPACSERIDIDLNNIPQRLVVDGEITSDTIHHRVWLSRTTDYYNPSTDSLGVSGATVYVQQGEQRFYYSEVPGQRGLYLSDSIFYGIEGKTYHLYVSDVDIDRDGSTEQYEAEETMPFIFAHFDSIIAIYGPGLPPLFDGRGIGWNICIFAKDSPTKEYYGFMVTINDTSFDARIMDMFRMDDQMVNGAEFQGFPLYFFGDEGRRPLHEGDTVKMEGVSISQQYNTYITMLKNIGGIPLFGGPPSNVRGNISGGALGYFAVYGNRHAQTICRKLATGTP